MFKIVVTGASCGIGLATALELARAGHQVVATMRNPGRFAGTGRAGGDGEPAHSDRDM